MTESLIALLKAEIYQHVDFDSSVHAVWYRNGLRKAIDIVRQHEAGQPEYKAYAYASRLLKHLAPQCTPLPDTLGVLTQIDNYITGLRAPKREIIAPEGSVMVPKEITPEMQSAYFQVIDRNLPRVETDATFGRFSNNAQAYRAMIAAAPTNIEDGSRSLTPQEAV